MDDKLRAAVELLRKMIVIPCLETGSYPQWEAVETLITAAERAERLALALQAHIQLYDCDGDYLEETGRKIQDHARKTLKEWGGM